VIEVSEDGNFVMPTPSAASADPDPRSFGAELRAATPVTFVTYLMASACVAVYAAMVLAGVSPLQPSIVSLLDWGANFGPYVAFDHQRWRLLTNVFVHIGLIHLALNMWALVSAAPLVERLYGNLGFAAIYILSGLGGSIASIAWNPTLVSAGASGAVFGVFGALGAFLALHRRAIPARILQPLRNSTVAFIGYNLVYGMMDARIDSAAHLGGLIIGFVAGLLLYRPWPLSSGSSALFRRLVLGLAVAGGLLAAERGVEARTRGKPGLEEASLANQRVRTALHGFFTENRAAIEDYEPLGRDIDRVLPQLDTPPPPPAAPPSRILDDLITRAEAHRAGIERTAANPGLDPSRSPGSAGGANAPGPPGVGAADQALVDPLRKELGAAYADLVLALRALKKFADTRDVTLVTGPGGFNAHVKASQSHMTAYSTALQDVARRYHLTLTTTKK
jgi:rhomboid protease GluP